jgi:hypothetical protein
MILTLSFSGVGVAYPLRFCFLERWVTPLSHFSS